MLRGSSLTQVRLLSPRASPLRLAVFARQKPLEILNLNESALFLYFVRPALLVYNYTCTNKANAWYPLALTPTETQADDKVRGGPSTLAVE